MNIQLDARQVEKISKALGDPYRLKIMDSIKKQKDWLPCCTINESIDLAQSTVSHHLKQLVDADILLSEKDGRNIRYSVNKEMLSAYINFISGFGK